MSEHKDISWLAMNALQEVQTDELRKLSASDRVAMSVLASAARHDEDALHEALANFMCVEANDERIKAVATRALELASVADVSRTSSTKDAHAPVIGTCRCLLQGGANVSVQSNGGLTPLINATKKGNVALMELLLEHGANPDQSVSSGQTALQHAVLCGSFDAARILLRAGADPHRHLGELGDFLRSQSFLGPYARGTWLLLAYGGPKGDSHFWEGWRHPLGDDAAITMEEAAVMASDQERLLELLQAAGPSAAKMLPGLRQIAQVSLDPAFCGQSNVGATQEIIALLDALQSRLTIGSIATFAQSKPQPI